MNLFSGTITTLGDALNYSSTKQKIISQNIANNDTPNYKAKEVSFKAALDHALSNSIMTKRTDIRHFQFQHQASNTVILKENSISYNENGNGVDIDKEMADLAKNQIYYSALTERLNGKFSTLQNVIRGGK